MNYFIPVFATPNNETRTLIIHAIPNVTFANKEEVFKHYHKMPWGSISDYRMAKKSGWIIKFDYEVKTK
jgi:hypothetical protein